MTAGSQRQLNAIRDFLLKAFSASELDELLYYATDPRLKAARDEYVDADGKPEKVRKVLDYCARWDLPGDLRAEIERARPGQFGTAAAAVVLALPADLADFTGREREIDRVLKQLDRKGAVTISGIHGMGGIGKMALAFEAGPNGQIGPVCNGRG